jgi:hypothetical protein
MGKLFTVHVKIGGGVGAAKLKKVEIGCGQGALVKRLFVKARAAEIIVTAILAVNGVKAVRKGNCLAAHGGNIGRILYKQPIVV